MSRPIVRIATIGIAVGIALMIISMAVVRGFQQEVRNKVIGFGSHMTVISNEDGRTKESSRILYEPSVKDALLKVDGVRHVQRFASKPGILETKESIQGVVIKGIGADFDWSFLESTIVDGRTFRGDSLPDRYEVIISAYIARRMKLSTGDKISLYFINNDQDARQQNFRVCGIYETGLEDFDQQYVFIPLNFVQKYSGWGLQAQILADTVCSSGYIALGGIGFGGEGEYSFDWDNEWWEGEGPFFIRPVSDTTISLVIHDESETLPDTVQAIIDYADDLSTEPCRPFVVRTVDQGGSEQAYIGGYEVLIGDYERLYSADADIEKVIPFYLTSVPVTDRNPEIFAWLEMLDINVIIIIVLMIAISIINMTSALLIIILERQSMIGTLKAFGIQNSRVMGIFLRNAAYIIGRGLIWGNLLGIGFILIQQFTHLIKLDPMNYYVDHVPVQFSVVGILLLNAGTLLVCLLALLLPASYVTRINPIRAIRFD